MGKWQRRSFLATGAVLSTGVGLASSGAGDADDGDDPSNVDGSLDAKLPDSTRQPNSDMNEDWASYRGDAGQTRCIADGHDFDGDALAPVWSVDHDGSVAVADDTVYTSTADGVVALDAEDGTLVWENTDVLAHDPAVAGGVVCLTTDEGVVALDRSDGAVRWEASFDPADSVTRHAVAYDAAFVVVDGTLYALEVDDGSIRWERESVALESPASPDGSFEFSRAPAAANGVVYAATQRTVLALEPQTGDEVWRKEEVYQDVESPIHANESAVVVDWWSDLEQGVHDPQTGEVRGLITSETDHEVSIGEDMYTTGDIFNLYGGSLEDCEHEWEVPCEYNAGQAVISGETVYVYFGRAEGDTGDYDQELAALDKDDGTEKWAISKDDAPIGYVRAISGDTLYVDHEGDLVAFREGAPDDGC
ncbi:PQQ-binding-like beta-propeller repeat protein [Natronosalvus halobius]|uniref:outer membrane protein assembly factor BamB family protein n=1 Tax=Natronosalvus halobius TaxID=2953746 RepID=UPI0020A21865|nr:PQQ-binding-like beta-propeller repeat protein [Natronosalvus halobius]USZ71658.1 PQQ-binding-like beta-propeller repeat protein [Natronosalvus halobius]